MYAQSDQETGNSHLHPTRGRQIRFLVPESKTEIHTNSFSPSVYDCGTPHPTRQLQSPLRPSDRPPLSLADKRSVRLSPITCFLSLLFCTIPRSYSIFFSFERTTSCGMLPELLGFPQYNEVTWCFTPGHPVRLHESDQYNEEEQSRNIIELTGIRARYCRMVDHQTM